MTTADRLMAELRIDRPRFLALCRDYIASYEWVMAACGFDDGDDWDEPLHVRLLDLPLDGSSVDTLAELRAAVRAVHDAGDCQCRERWSGDLRRIVETCDVCNAAGIGADV